MTYFPAPVGNEMKTSLVPEKKEKKSIFMFMPTNEQTIDNRLNGFFLTFRSKLFKTEFFQALFDFHISRHNSFHSLNQSRTNGEKIFSFHDFTCMMQSLFSVQR